MGNPTNGVTRLNEDVYPFRFDKAPADAVVDLINYSNKAHIPYGEIEVDRVTALPEIFQQSVQVNTSARIRMRGASADAPSSTVLYSRLDIADHVGQSDFFRFSPEDPTETLYQQLLERHGILLSPQDSTLMIGPGSSEGVHVITFVPASDHPVWIGELVLEAGPQDHIKNLVKEGELDGLTRDQLAT